MALDAKEILDKYSEEQGWNDESEIIHLCGFIDELADKWEKILHQPGSEISVVLTSFRNYLAVIQQEENVDELPAGVEAVCEQCGAPCDYDTEICLCPKCKRDE